MTTANVIEIEAVLRTRKVEQGFKTIENVLDQIENDISKVAQKLQRKMLSIGLSFLFTGMAMKRMADSALRSIFTTMQLASGETSEFNTLTNKLTANWEFFKFTLVDALMQTGLFQGFIGFLIDVINSFNELSPLSKRVIVILLVGLSFIGGAMMVFGQATLAAIGFIELFGLSSAKSLSSVAGKLIVVAAAATIAWNKANSGGNDFENVLGSLGGVLLGMGVILKWVGVTAFGAWALAIGGAIILGLAFKEELGIAFGFLAHGAIYLGSLILKFIVSPLTHTLRALIAINKFFGRNTSGLENTLRKINEITNLTSAKEWSSGRIDALMEQRQDRPNLLSRLGILPEGLFPEAPTLPSTGSTGTTQSTNTIQIQEMNINTGAVADTGQTIAQDVMKAMEEEMNRGIGSPMFG